MPASQHLVRAVAIGLACALVACTPKRVHDAASARSPRCPEGMAAVAATGDERNTPSSHAFCIDRWEASLLEMTRTGEVDFSPYQTVANHQVRAVTRPNVVPQAYISRNEAAAACSASHKRLCEEREWLRACEGGRPTTFPYGSEHKAGYCNDHGRPPLAALFSDNVHSWESMNDPRLNQIEGTVAKTGTFSRCETPDGAYDMVGNLHEWVADPAGTFLGGYFLDTTQNGAGCNYKTVAHDASYHDYSTGFRCCADVQ